MSTHASNAPALEAQQRENATASGSASQGRPVSHRVLLGWMFSVTRPILSPLLASTACRIVDLLAGVGLFALAGYAVAQAGISLAAGQSVHIAPVMIAMVVLSLIKAVLRYGEQFLGHFVAFKALELLRGEVFASLIPRSPRVMLTAHSGDLLTRATKDVDRIEVFFAHTFAPMVSAVVVPVVTVLTIGVTVSWPVATAAAVVLLVAIAVVPALGSRISLTSWRRAASVRSRVSQHVTDSVQGLTEVVGYGRIEERLAELATMDQEISRAARPASLVASARRGTEQFLLLAGPLAVLAMGAAGVQAGTVSAPALAAAAAAVLRLAEPVRAVEELAASLNASFASAERVYETVHAPIEREEGTAVLRMERSHEITWENVTYSYPARSGHGTESKPALIDVTATARAGEWTCIVGASGSGKSTMAALAVRVDDPTAGRVLIDGADIRRYNDLSIVLSNYLLTQRAHIFRGTVTDNVRLPDHVAPQESVEQTCKDAGIHEEILAMPQGYDTLIGERGTSISGGQRQRLAFARALIARPGVLILDEFTSHLDPQLDARLRGVIRQRLPESTVVEITHRLDHVDQADHVIVMDAGRVVESGSPASLLADPSSMLSRLRAREI